MTWPVGRGREEAEEEEGLRMGGWNARGMGTFNLEIVHVLYDDYYRAACIRGTINYHPRCSQHISFPAGLCNHGSVRPSKQLAYFPVLYVRARISISLICLRGFSFLFSSDGRTGGRTEMIRGGLQHKRIRFSACFLPTYVRTYSYSSSASNFLSQMERSSGEEA